MKDFCDKIAFWIENLLEHYSERVLRNLGGMQTTSVRGSLRNGPVDFPDLMKPVMLVEEMVVHTEDTKAEMILRAMVRNA